MPRSSVPSAPEPVLTTATLSQQVYQHLRMGILANDYPPGTPLPEEALAVRFKVSRVPVREALRRLASEGLVTLTPRLGATVSSLSPKQFLDAYQVREALEVLAIRLALPHLTPEDVKELDELQERMRRAASANDSDEFFGANAAFHARFVERAGNDDLKVIYEGLIDRMRRYRWPSMELRGGMDRSVEEHQEILDAVQTGDVEAAAHLLAEHIHVPQRMLQSELEVSGR